MALAARLPAARSAPPHTARRATRCCAALEAAQEVQAHTSGALLLPKAAALAAAR
jgi:hypothetical protein